MRRSASRAQRSGQSELATLDGSARQRLSLRSVGPGAARRNIRACTISATGRSSDLKASIDWTPFFRAWELAGNYPAILDDPVVGESARNLFDDAQEMLDQIIAERWVTPKATVGLWRCKREGDDVLVLAGNDWTRAALPPPAGEEARGPRRTCASPTSSIPTARTGSAASRSASTGSNRTSSGSRRDMTIIRTSC